MSCCRRPMISQRLAAFEALTNPPASTRPYDESLMTAAVAVVGGKQAASGIRSAEHTFAQLATGSLLNTHTQSHLQPSSLITPRCFASKAGRRLASNQRNWVAAMMTVTKSPSTCHSSNSAFPLVVPWLPNETYERSCRRLDGECLFVSFS